MGGIFKAYDIRGKYPDELNEEFAEKIGRAFARYLGVKRIVIARDMRLSSPSLSLAFLKGIASTGTDAVDIGMTTTPMLYFAIKAGDFGGGAMVTASHLPADNNGFKLCREQAIPLSGTVGLPQIEKMVRKNRFNGSTQRAGDITHQTMFSEYMDHIASFVVNPNPLRIVVDAGNGMVGEEIFALFKKFSLWKLSPMYMEPDGRFPHHVANPLLVSTTKDLEARVKKEKADLGVAFDGDADRCGLIDEQGKRIPEDIVTALIAQSLLSRHPGETILYDLRSSRVVPETITKAGGNAVRCQVGHSFIKAQMRRKNALFAGELSGHYYFRNAGFTDNALCAIIQVVNLLSRQGISLSRLVEPLMKYCKTGEINIRVKDKEEIFSKVEGHYHGVHPDHLDGLTIEHESWWFNLRASNTEPLIRLNLEANDTSSMEQKKKEVIDVIRNADPTAVFLKE